jgi:phosphate uptake regulator
MKRKVVKQGTSTLMISLPSDWAHRFKIGKGDELEVEERGRTVLVSTQKENFDRETELDIDNLYPMTMRVVAAIYKAGYDKLKINFSDPKRIIDINNVVRDEISGFEVIEQGKNYCVVKKIEEGLQEGFEPVLRRIFLLLLNMAEDSYESIKKGDYDDLERLVYLEQSNNRLTTYCRRFLSKKGYKEHDKIQFIYHIIEQLEKIADQYKFLFDHIIKSKTPKFKISKDVLEYYKNVNIVLRSYYELFYKFDRQKIVEIGTIRARLTKDISRHIDNGGSDAVIVHHLSIILQDTFNLVGPYLSMVL